jgi:CubicO group peptidase (beta-lactamase class C family)
MMSIRGSKTHRLALVSVLGVLLASSLLLASTRGVEIALSDLPTAEPEDVGMSSERLQRVNTTMQRYIDNNQLAGTVTLIARHGKIVHVAAQGWRDKEADQRMTPDGAHDVVRGGAFSA